MILKGKTPLLGLLLILVSCQEPTQPGEITVTVYNADYGTVSLVRDGQTVARNDFDVNYDGGTVRFSKGQLQLANGDYLLKGVSGSRATEKKFSYSTDFQNVELSFGK